MEVPDPSRVSGAAEILVLIDEESESFRVLPSVEPLTFEGKETEKAENFELEELGIVREGNIVVDIENVAILN